MARARIVLGFVAGGMLLLSSVAHSFVGWSFLGSQLAATNAPADLVTGLKIGWRFGGAAMVAFGVIVIATFLKRLRGQAVSMLPAALVTVTYLAFGAWALLESNFDPFFFVFIVPGTLLAIALAGTK